MREPGIAARSHFSGIAGRRLRVLVAGSTVIPTDSSAVTPKTGSTPGVRNITRPAVVSPMNSIRTSPKGYSLTVPSANSNVILPSCLIPSFSSSSEGATESVAPVSTRNNDSNDFFGSIRFESFVVTFVNPIAPKAYYWPQVTAISDDLGYAFQFFLRIRPSLHGHGAHEHAGMDK
jgi:hypothetical protein